MIILPLFRDIFSQNEPTPCLSQNLGLYSHDPNMHATRCWFEDHKRFNIRIHSPNKPDRKTRPRQYIFPRPEIEYYIQVPCFYLVLHGLRCQKTLQWINQSINLFLKCNLDCIFSLCKRIYNCVFLSLKSVPSKCIVTDTEHYNTFKIIRQTRNLTFTALPFKAGSTTNCFKIASDRLDRPNLIQSYTYTMDILIIFRMGSMLNVCT